MAKGARVIAALLSAPALAWAQVVPGPQMTGAELLANLESQHEAIRYGAIMWTAGYLMGARLAGLSYRVGKPMNCSHWESLNAITTATVVQDYLQRNPKAREQLASTATMFAFRDVGWCKAE